MIISSSHGPLHTLQVRSFSIPREVFLYLYERGSLLLSFLRPWTLHRLGHSLWHQVACLVIVASFWPWLCFLIYLVVSPSFTPLSPDWLSFLSLIRARPFALFSVEEWLDHRGIFLLRGSHYRSPGFLVPVQNKRIALGHRSVRGLLSLDKGEKEV